MASHRTVATICLLLVAQVTHIQAPIPGLLTAIGAGAVGSFGALGTLGAGAVASLGALGTLCSDAVGSLGTLGAGAVGSLGTLGAGAVGSLGALGTLDAGAVGSLETLGAGAVGSLGTLGAGALGSLGALGSSAIAGFGGVAMGDVISAAGGAVSTGTSYAGSTIQTLMSLPYPVTMGKEIENWTKFELMKPQYTVVHGVITTPPSPVRPGQKEAMVARKSSFTTSGSYGVVSWEIAGKSRRLVVMWSVPLNTFLHGNVLAVGITKQNVNHDGGWANQMYNSGSNERLGFERKDYYHDMPTVHWEDSNLGLMFFATMSNTQHALVEVTFSAMNESDLADSIRDNLAKNRKKRSRPSRRFINGA
ncbi:conoporin-Cn1-like [Dreissena polymorpha]|uniref:Uncharacterized protein n=1 Tax=Dreissena polymorpha TaxID=45954 RepID=A0A9D4M823_DREPO|nr:conoporin-Cn1-like [Dreissena polymorpha]KAH3871450.1 hypothetical protein DPMN_034652 [Dreissena polymorpha]